MFKRFSNYILARLKFTTYFAGLSGLPGRHYLGSSDLTYTFKLCHNKCRPKQFYYNKHKSDQKQWIQTGTGQIQHHSVW